MSAILNVSETNYQIPVAAASSNEESYELDKDTLDLLAFIYLLQENGAIRRESFYSQGKQTEVWSELQRALNNKLSVLGGNGSAEMETQEVTKQISTSNLNPFTWLFKSFIAEFYTGPRKQEMHADANKSIKNAYTALWQGVKEGKPLEVALFSGLVVGAFFSGPFIPTVIFLGIDAFSSTATGLEITDKDPLIMIMTTTQDNRNKFTFDQMENFTIMVIRQDVEGQITIYQQSSNTALTEFDTEGKAITQITQITTNMIQDWLTLSKKANLRTR